MWCPVKGFKKKKKCPFLIVLKKKNCKDLSVVDYA